MNTISVSLLLVVLVVLICVAAFFAASETAMMAVNRYRVRHLERQGDARAKRVMSLLRRPDRILGVILIGNTFANIMASSVVTLVVAHFFGEVGVLIATVLLTFVMLVFGETMPKTLAALRPQRVAFPVSLPLQVLLRIFYPLVWLVNGISNGILFLFQIKVKEGRWEALTVEELRTLVREASGKLATNYQQMLLRILEMEKATVEDVMVPRNEIEGIDLTESWESILNILTSSEYSHLPIYRENVDRVVGILMVKKVLPELYKPDFDRQRLLALADEVLYVPEVTPLNRQLIQFQEARQSIALVVDEYGDIQGLVTLADIVEEIVGEFSDDMAQQEELIQKQKDGSYWIDGRMNIRDLNRATGWHLPSAGPRTLSGLIIEHLEVIPDSPICLMIANYHIEVLAIFENVVEKVHIWPVTAEFTESEESHS